MHFASLVRDVAVAHEIDPEHQHQRKPDYATFRTAAEKSRTDQFIIHAVLIERMQHKVFLPELGEDDTAFVQEDIT